MNNRALINRALNLCSSYEIMHNEFSNIKSLLVANGYPSTFIDGCIHRFLSKHNNISPNPDPSTFGPRKKKLFLSLPFTGENSTKLRRQLQLLLGAVLPCAVLRTVFKPVCKLSVLCKLKSPYTLLSRSNVIYKVDCSDCGAFYIGKTIRRLEQRLHEHSTDSHSALLRHSTETGHHINYQNPQTLAFDTNELRLYIKETFKISELSAHQSLKSNVGSLDLKLR